MKNIFRFNKVAVLSTTLIFSSVVAAQVPNGGTSYRPPSPDLTGKTSNAAFSTSVKPGKSGRKGPDLTGKVPNTLPEFNRQVKNDSFARSTGGNSSLMLSVGLLAVLGLIGAGVATSRKKAK